MDYRLLKYTEEEKGIIKKKLYEKCLLLKINITISDDIETLYQLYKLKVADEENEIAPDYDDILYSYDEVFYKNPKRNN